MESETKFLKNNNSIISILIINQNKIDKIGHMIRYEKNNRITAKQHLSLENFQKKKKQKKIETILFQNNFFSSGITFVSIILSYYGH